MGLNKIKCLCINLDLGLGLYYWVGFTSCKTRAEADLLATLLIFGMGLDKVHFSKLVWPRVNKLAFFLGFCGFGC